jgi:hypothetical protein
MQLVSRPVRKVKGLRFRLLATAWSVSTSLVLDRNVVEVNALSFVRAFAQMLRLKVSALPMPNHGLLTEATLINKL